MTPNATISHFAEIYLKGVVQNYKKNSVYFQKRVMSVITIQLYSVEWGWSAIPGTAQGQR